MAIAIPQERTSPIERLGMLLGVIDKGASVVQGFKDRSRQNDEREAQEKEIAELNDPASSKRSALLETASKLNINLPSTASGKDLYAFKNQMPELNKIFAQKTVEHKNRLGEIEHGKNLEHKSRLGEIAARADEERKTALARATDDRRKNPSKYAFEQLPKENQVEIEKLATNNANKVAIKNELDKALQQLRSPQLSEDQKVKVGQGLLKTLNSTQGADAVGAEESKRLGSFLEYKLANLTGPGSFIGRDVDEFVDQVALISEKVGHAKVANDARIKELYGQGQAIASSGSVVPPLQGKSVKKQRPGGLIPEAMAGKQTQFDAKDLEALQWLQANPNSPDAPAVAAKLRQKGLE